MKRVASDFVTGGEEREIDEEFLAASKAHAEAVELVLSFGGDYAVPYDDPGHPRHWTAEKRAALDAALDRERRATVAFSRAVARLRQYDDYAAE